VVDSPDEYYTIVAFLDLFEFLFRLNRREMIDIEIWYRWPCQNDNDNTKI
jgi:hypothetical protein